MLETKAVLRNKDTQIEAVDCVVDHVIHLSGDAFDDFSRNLLNEYDFIRDSKSLLRPDSDGRAHCLLVLSEGRRDGILVDPSGTDYARHSALLPNAELLLTMNRYPTLAALNKKLVDFVDVVAEHVGAGHSDGRGVMKLSEWNALLGLDLATDSTLRDTLLGMLGERPEIQNIELTKDELIIYRAQEPSATALPVSSVEKTDMYDYGYTFEGMIPHDRDGALALFDSGHEVFLLYPDGTEGAAHTREEIESFDGMFGIEDSSWKEPAPAVTAEAHLPEEKPSVLDQIREARNNPVPLSPKKDTGKNTMEFER